MLGLYASPAYRRWFKYLMWTSAVDSHDKKSIRLCDGTLNLCNKHYEAIGERTSTLVSNSDSSLYHNFLQIFLLALQSLLFVFSFQEPTTRKNSVFFSLCRLFTASRATLCSVKFINFKSLKVHRYIFRAIWSSSGAKIFLAKKLLSSVVTYVVKYI
jgi:hypothetical protein